MPIVPEDRVVDANNAFERLLSEGYGRSGEELIVACRDVSVLSAMINDLGNDVVPYILFVVFCQSTKRLFESRG